MSFKKSINPYSPIAKALHWSSALLAVGLLVVGFYMVSIDFSPFKLELYGLHKSFGTLALLFIIVRIALRVISGHKVPKKKIAHYLHYILYAMLFVMPVSGWVMSNAGGYPFGFFGLFQMPVVVDENKDLFNQMRIIHEIVAYIIIAFAAGHIAVELKRFFKDKIGILKAMMPGRRFSPVALGLVVAVIALLAISVGMAFNAVPHSKILPKLLSAGSSLQVENVDTVAAIAPPPLSASTAPQWMIDHSASTLGFSVEVQGAPYSGTFPKFDGEIFFDQNDLSASRVDIAIDLTSVKSQSLEWNGYLSSEIWFYTESFPESRFVANRFEKTEESGYLARGKLTLKGQAHPLDIAFTLDFTGDDHVVMVGKTSFNRLDYGLGEGSWADGKMVGHMVDVEILLNASNSN
jgi:cytochrome b561/polyisoprenoid-binding protein YceI